jgi:hypothetical protein
VHADGDAAFAFKVHGIEELILEIALADGAGLEQELVREGAFAMIDVSDDGEIAYAAGFRAHGLFTVPVDVETRSSYHASIP